MTTRGNRADNCDAQRLTRRCVAHRQVQLIYGHHVLPDDISLMDVGYLYRPLQVQLRAVAESGFSQYEFVHFQSGYCCIIGNSIITIVPEGTFCAFKTE